MQRKKGFTLIELLIVVAIIAILAAIAVPNFLEAQVRSKVSRQLSNMRTLATAVESYYVDANAYPLTTVAPYDLGLPPEAQYKFYPGELTTPIAYLSSDAPMEDIFRKPHHFTEPLAYQVMWHPSLIYDPDGPYTHWGSKAIWAAQRNRYGEWVMRSAGPDTYYYNMPGVRADYGAGGWNLASYDPTNGTVSAGDIYRSQKRSEEQHK
ncbi:prepilin-type N-terminal cleavage/methylation domain-containing protein [Candidatus Sumerlaeota bacterium]|nr:prepilin-type N-terminal cleavage/methylation domain-containing protein [Candidatus Sumerlaeota bacterium]